MARIAHRTFLQPPFDLRIFKPFPDLDEEIRQQAEAFIHEIDTTGVQLPAALLARQPSAMAFRRGRSETMN